MKSPLITTIIPTYRRPNRLKNAIQSVLNQTYPHFQVWIYDNASQDDTAAVVAQFCQADHRVKYHCHENNVGPARNFEYGLSKVETPFFSFLSDDDYLIPEFYETALEGLERYPDAGFFSGAVIDVNENHKIIDVVLTRWNDCEYYPCPQGFLEIIGKYSNWIGTLFRKDVIQKNGSIDCRLKTIDIDYVLRAAQHFPFIISKKPVAVFVQHALSYSHAHGLKLIWPGWDIMILKIRDSPILSSEVKAIAEKKLRADLLKLLTMNALLSLKNKDFKQVDAIVDVYTKMDQKGVQITLIHALANLCKSIPLFHSLVLSLVPLRRVWNWRWWLKRARLRLKYKKFINPTIL